MEIHKLQQLLSEMSLQEKIGQMVQLTGVYFDKEACLLYTSPSPRDAHESRMPSSA